MLQFLVNTNFPIIPLRRTMMTISLILILIGIGSLVMKGGPNYGIDFKGGYKFIVEFTDAVKVQRGNAAFASFTGTVDSSITAVATARSTTISPPPPWPSG